ncbi:MAG: AAA family ATPase [Asgard group archaeon]|nr:AAA family ATPase [Asgard group archaeon]
MTNIMLTGFPRVGKTTVIMRFLEKTRRECSGFYTEEIKNQNGRREGFKVVGISTGEVGILAHINVKSFRKVGKYFVDIEGFEAVALPEMDTKAEIVIIDEIGKMELYSSKFKFQLLHNLNNQNVLATITKKGGGNYVELMKKREDIELIELTKQNRDEVVKELLERIG